MHKAAAKFVKREKLAAIAVLPQTEPVKKEKAAPVMDKADKLYLYIKIKS